MSEPAQPPPGHAPAGRADVSAWPAGAAKTPPARRAADAAEPVISPAHLRFFGAYTRRYLARHFHAVRLHAASAGALGENRPAIIYLNHASWWDPLVCLFLGRECFPARPAFAPMEAAQLARYGIFRRLGMFGVEPGTRRGAVTFLRTGSAVLARPEAMLWLTPEARFADTRARPLRFAGGLAQLARRNPAALLVPLAIEYPFWGERLPEALVSFGPSESADTLSAQHPSDDALTAHLEARLAATMSTLAAASIARDAAEFQILLAGRGGVAGLYDGWRRLRAALRGEPFSADHGTPPR